MDIKTQWSGVNELLGVIYGNGTQLSTLLCDIGFERSQVEQMQDGQLESVISQFLEVIHNNLPNLFSPLI